MASTQSPTTFDGKAGTKVVSKLSELSLNAREGEPKDSGADDAPKSNSHPAAKASVVNATPSKQAGKPKCNSKSGFTPLPYSHGKDPTLSPGTGAMSE